MPSKLQRHAHLALYAEVCLIPTVARAAHLTSTSSFIKTAKTLRADRWGSATRQPA